MEGNERADQAAKAAATSCTTPPTTRMKSAQNRSIQSMAKTKWETEWKTGRGNVRRLRNMSQHHDTTTRPTLYGALQQRKHVVFITRLRTGHCHLNEYLYRFSKIETPECECGAGRETVDHFTIFRVTTKWSKSHYARIYTKSDLPIAPTLHFSKEHFPIRFPLHRSQVT